MQDVDIFIYDKSGNVVGYNLESTESTVDWIRGARLLKENPDAFDEIDKKPAYWEYEPSDDDEVFE